MRRLFLTVILALCPAWAAAQPTIGSQVESAVVAADTSVDLASVDTGAAVFVIVFQTGSGARTYSVSDSEATGNVYDSVVNNNCGTGRCIQIFADYSISPGDGTLTITVDQSASATYMALAFEVNPSTSAAEQDTFSSLAQTTTVTHLTSADSTVIDTTTNVFVFSACTGDASFSTETVKSGGWTALSTTNSNQAMGQYLSQAAAFTDERAELTSLTSRPSWCAVVSVKQAAAGGRPPNGLSLQGVGV